MLIYLLTVNAFGFAIMLYDKYLAKNKLWRVPEKSLFGVAILGGSMGCILGMYTARHKTKHRSFTVGMPAIFLLQLALGLYWIIYK